MTFIKRLLGFEPQAPEPISWSPQPGAEQGSPAQAQELLPVDTCRRIKAIQHIRSSYRAVKADGTSYQIDRWLATVTGAWTRWPDGTEEYLPLMGVAVDGDLEYFLLKNINGYDVDVPLEDLEIEC